MTNNKQDQKNGYCAFCEKKHARDSLFCSKECEKIVLALMHSSLGNQAMASMLLTSANQGKPS